MTIKLENVSNGHKGTKSPSNTMQFFNEITEIHAHRLITLMDITDDHRRNLRKFEARFQQQQHQPPPQPPQQQQSNDVVQRETKRRRGNSKEKQEGSISPVVRIVRALSPEYNYYHSKEGGENMPRMIPRTPAPAPHTPATPVSVSTIRAPSSLRRNSTLRRPSCTSFCMSVLSASMTDEEDWIEDDGAQELYPLVCDDHANAHDCVKTNRKEIALGTTVSKKSDVPYDTIPPEVGKENINTRTTTTPTVELTYHCNGYISHNNHKKRRRRSSTTTSGGQHQSFLNLRTKSYQRLFFPDIDVH